MKNFLTRHWKKIVLGGMALAVLGFFGLGLLIGHGVRDALFVAQRRFPGDPVTALMTMAVAEDQVLSVRNHSIWALGQIGTPEALPTLRSLVTDANCDHAHAVCQKEVKKAVEACSGEVNIGAFIWRHGDLAVVHRGTP
jgi:hypothetical protein